MMLKDIALRNWQQDAFERFQIENKDTFMLVANPGAGKTGFALHTAKKLLISKRIERIVIVCPTLQLKQQWSLSAKKNFSLNIDADLSNYNCMETDSYHGAALTYHQVCSLPEIHRLNCHKKRTMVIFDEVHHVGDTLKWGDAVVRAFENAEIRLALSGTPFRADNNPIPFIEYEGNKSKSDYAYTYAQALRDGICRYVFFPSFEGEMKWKSFGNVIRANFETKLNPMESSRRLRTALSPDGQWLNTVIRQADEKLNDIRKNHHDAGGLIVAIDQFHAKQIAQLIFNITGEAPTLAISEDSEALNLIKEFSESSKKWIVAVKMVSEGVDIPRLRVGIYASNCTSELFFRQVVGRFIRVVPNLPEQNAYLFIPKDETLKLFAATIMKERDHRLKEDLTLPIRRTCNVSNKNTFRVLSSLAKKDDVISADGDIMSANLISFAEQIKFNANISLPAEDIAKTLQPSKYKVSYGIKSKDLLNKNIYSITKWIDDKTSVGFSQIHGKINRLIGISSNLEDVSNELLERKLDILFKLKNLLMENNNAYKQTYNE